MLGIDVIEIERIRSAAQKDSFYEGVYTESEREYYKSRGSRAETLAGMFCAKEAVAKALGSGFVGFRPNSIEISHTESGAPYARLIGAAAEKFPNAEIEISISHCEEYAAAVAFVKA